MEQGAILQNDNTHLHRAHVVEDILQQQQVTHVDRSAHSPDLSPIEHL